MRERRRIIELWKRADSAALVTLVRLQGSNYRRPGARLLIAANGDYAGAISGGCLEAEVVRRAQWKVRSGAVVERYSTLFDDTAEIPYGLGCGGSVDLLFEPAGTPEFDALMSALADSLNNATRHVITTLPEHGKQFTRIIRDAAGKTVFPESGRARGESAWGAGNYAAGATVLSASALGCVAGASEFEEWLESPQRLFVFGAGDDAQPIVQMAALLGWTVVVVDGRALWARAERFPQAERVLVASSLADLPLGPLRVSERDAAVIMTHSYEQDRAWLAELLPCAPRYLGLLGARHRSALLVSEVASLLGWEVEKTCEALFAPVGLDLGGEGAEAIALAVVAEIQACCEGKLGVSRRMTAEAVAEQVAQGGVSRYLQAQCLL